MAIRSASSREVSIIRSKTASALLALALLSASLCAAAQEPERGRLKSGHCAACHGADGVSPNPLFPHLAGQRAGYLQLQLEAFQAGDRYDPLMTPVAQSLTREDIDDLAAYYSRLGLPARTERSPNQRQ